MTRLIRAAAVAAAACLSACGGGGGGGSDPPPPVDTSVTVALAGTAAKGPMANADVAVYAVAADGTVGSTALATGTTSATGAYSLNFSATAGQPYVVKVTAKAGTTHLDEVTGAPQALPAGFTMRSLLVPSGSGSATTSATITPFSELAVAAASRATGGITAANATQALSTVKQLLGFDPAAVAPKTTGTASGADEQRLAVMLTAVSKMAEGGALGCGAGAAGDKVKCVVDALAAAASTGTLKLSSGSGAGAVDVSAALNSAVSEVLTTPALAGNVSSATLAVVVANLGCGSSCTVGSSGGPGTVATAIAGAKLMFTEMRTDWAGMFSRGGASTTAAGAVNKEAGAFKTAMSGLQSPLQLLGKDVGAVMTGIDLYNDYLAGRTTVSSRGRGDQSLYDSSGFNSLALPSGTGCTLYTDSTNTTQAQSQSQAKSIGCAARYYVLRSFGTNSSLLTEWRHGFTITPNTDGSFGYTTRTRRRVTTCITGGCSVTANDALQTDFYAGTVTPVLSADHGSVRSFTWKGELPGAFQSGSTSVINLKQALDIAGAQSAPAADGTITSTIAGTLTAYKLDGSVESTLTIKTGTMKQVAVSAADPNGTHEPSELDLDLVWGTGTAEFEGHVAATDSTQDASKTQRLPTKWLLSGALRNISGGTKTEFLSGQFGFTITGFAGFDASKPLTATNNYNLAMTLLGTVSAANRPTLALSFGGNSTAFDTGQDRPLATATLQYRSLVNGTPRLVVALTAENDATGLNPRFRITEATANLSLAWTGEIPATVDVNFNGTTKIGSIDPATGVLTFSDGSFISLDAGL